MESVGGRNSLVIWKETFKTYVDIIDILQKELITEQITHLHVRETLKRVNS